MIKINPLLPSASLGQYLIIATEKQTRTETVTRDVRSCCDVPDHVFLYLGIAWGRMWRILKLCVLTA